MTDEITSMLYKDVQDNTRNKTYHFANNSMINTYWGIGQRRQIENNIIQKIKIKQ